MSQRETASLKAEGFYRTLRITDMNRPQERPTVANAAANQAGLFATVGRS